MSPYQRHTTHSTEPDHADAASHHTSAPAMSTQTSPRPAIGPDYSPPASLRDPVDSASPAQTHTDLWNKAFAGLEDYSKHNARMLESQKRQLNDLHDAFARMRGEIGSIWQHVRGQTDEIRTATQLLSAIRDSREMESLSIRVDKVIVKVDSIDKLHTQLDAMTRRVRQLEYQTFAGSPARQPRQTPSSERSPTIPTSAGPVYTPLHARMPSLQQTPRHEAPPEAKFQRPFPGSLTDLRPMAECNQQSPATQESKVLPSLRSIDAASGITSWQSRPSKDPLTHIRSPLRPDVINYEARRRSDRTASFDTSSFRPDDNPPPTKRQNLAVLISRVDETTKAAHPTVRIPESNRPPPTASRTISDNSASHAHATSATSDPSHYTSQRPTSQDVASSVYYRSDGRRDRENSIAIARSAHRSSRVSGHTLYDVYRDPVTGKSIGWERAPPAHGHEVAEAHRQRQSSHYSHRASSRDAQRSVRADAVQYLQHGEKVSSTSSNTGKKSRTKPIRNPEGVLIRKDGRPDMRSISSAMNLRKVHAKKEARRQGSCSVDGGTRDDDQDDAEMISPSSSMEDDQQSGGSDPHSAVTGPEDASPLTPHNDDEQHDERHVSHEPPMIMLKRKHGEMESEDAMSASEKKHDRQRVDSVREASTALLENVRTSHGGDEMSVK